jgi:hypothetical protein
MAPHRITQERRFRHALQFARTAADTDALIETYPVSAPNRAVALVQVARAGRHLRPAVIAEILRTPTCYVAWLDHPLATDAHRRRIVAWAEALIDPARRVPPSPAESAHLTIALGLIDYLLRSRADDATRGRAEAVLRAAVRGYALGTVRHVACREHMLDHGLGTTDDLRRLLADTRAGCPAARIAAHPAADVALHQALIERGPSPDVLLAIVRTPTSRRHPAIQHAIVQYCETQRAHLPSRTIQHILVAVAPALDPAALRALVRWQCEQHPDTALTVLERAGRVRRSAVTATDVAPLLAHPDSAIRQRALHVLARVSSHPTPTARPATPRHGRRA